MSKQNDPQAQHAAALRWTQADQMGQLKSLYRRRSSEPRDQTDQQRINDLMRWAAHSNSPKCLQYLAQELGGDIHHTPNRKQATTMDLAIYCANAKHRGRMFQALMSVAKADELDSRAFHWTQASRAAMQMGDDGILRDLAAFAGSARFSRWIVDVRDSDGEDAWCLSARGGNPSVIDILLGIPEMKARLIATAPSSNGLHVANLAKSLDHEDFALAILNIVASLGELAAIESSCPSSNAQCRPPTRRM